MKSDRSCRNDAWVGIPHLPLITDFKMITRPINQVFSYVETNGRIEVTLEVVQGHICSRCYFESMHYCTEYADVIGVCSSLLRTDGNSVIFKLKKLTVVDSILEII